MLVQVDPSQFDHPIHQVHALPGFLHVDLLALVGQLTASQHPISDENDHFFCQIHHLLVVGVSPVEFEHGELGIMGAVDAFIAKITADLVDAFEATHQQPLEIELEGNAQVEILLELVVMGDKWARRRPAVDGLEDGRLNLKETARVQEVSQGAHNSRPAAENLAHFWIDSQVGVALAVAHIWIRQQGVADQLTIDDLVFGSRQGSDSLG